MITINTEKIKALNPCEDGLENYLKYHENFEGTFEEFLDLENISDADKVWVFSHLKEIPDNIKRRFAVWCMLQCETEVKELKDFQALVLKLYESTNYESIEHLKDATYSVAYSAAYWAANWATYSVAYSAAYRAADDAVEWATWHAADWANFITRDREKQVDKIKELLK